MTAEELEKVEGLVNAHVFLGETIETNEMSIEDARKTGAMALFGEKYGATVRVVKMGNFSTELCGGTHLDNTAKTGLFKIISESSVAAGVRRIEATTGLGVLRLLGERDALINETAKELRANNPADIAKRAAAVSAELKSSAREIEMLNAKIASSKTDGIKNSAKTVGACTLMVGKLEGVALDSARQITDDFKANDATSVTVLAVVNEGKLNFVCACGKDAVAAGAHAGNILKKLSVICGGGGGGRPDSATSGGKDLSKIDAALAAAEETLASMLK
jgi:alanyl-tRNA synthetase